MWLFDRYVIGGIAIVAAVSLLLAFILGRRTSWSERRIVRVAALPIPTIVVALAIYILIDAYTATREECGVDACGMAAAGAMMLLAVAIVAFLISLGLAKIGFGLSRR